MSPQQLNKCLQSFTDPQESKTEIFKQEIAYRYSGCMGSAVPENVSKTALCIYYTLRVLRDETLMSAERRALAFQKFIRKGRDTGSDANLLPYQTRVPHMYALLAVVTRGAMPQ